MKRMDNRGNFTLRRKTFLAVGGVALALVVVAWVLLIAGVFGKKSDKKNPKNNVDGGRQTPGEYQIPDAVPDGYVLVFRPVAIYSSDVYGNMFLYEKQEFDENGLSVVRTYYRSDGTNKTKYNDEYDSEGRKTESTEYTWDKEWVVSKKTVYEYDDSVGTRKTTTRNYDGSEEALSFSLIDADGHVLLSSSESADGEILYYHEENYLPDGRLLWIKTDNSATRYLYDEAGQIKSIEYYDVNGELVQEEIFLSAHESEHYRYAGEESVLFEKNEYDDRGNRTRHIVLDKDGTVLTDLRLEYDEDGRNRKSIMYMDGNFRSWQENEYKGPRNSTEARKTIEKNQDGKILKITEEEYFLGLYTTKHAVYDGEGNMEPHGIYSEYDSYGNPVRTIEKEYDGTEATMIEFEFIPLAIPEKFATEYDLREK